MASDGFPYSKWFTRIAWVLRKLHLTRILKIGREAACYHTLKRFHVEVLHQIRNIAVSVPDLKTDLEKPSTIAQVVCTECRKLMGTLLELPEGHLHCCIKVFVETEGSGSDLVATWVRSEPLDDRPSETGRDNAHRVRKNTVWASILGENDGSRQWRPHRAFACNDLGSHHGQFKCTRKEWQHYYRSSVAFPIRFPIDPCNNQYKVLGFLTFDSPIAGVFRKIPDIFEYFDKGPAQYAQDLDASLTFHMGGILADSLAAFLQMAQGSQSQGVRSDG